MMRAVIMFLMIVLMSGMTIAQDQIPVEPDPSDPEAYRQFFMDQARTYWPAMTREEFADIKTGMIVGEGFDAAALNFDPIELQENYGIVLYESVTVLREATTDAAAALDAILLIGLRLESLSAEDLVWLGEHYRDGLVFGFVNVPVQERMVMMAWAECSRTKHANVIDPPIDFYIVYAFKVAVNVVTDFSLAMEDVQNCEQIRTARFEGTTSIVRSFATDTVSDDARDIFPLQLLRNIAIRVHDVREAEAFTADSKSE